MRTTFVRRNAVKLLATVALVAGAAGVAGVGTFGAYTDTTTAEAAVSSGKVSVLMNGSGGGITVNTTNMAAGDQRIVPVTIEREKDSLKLARITVNTVVGGDEALKSALRLKVEMCSAQVAPDGGCASVATLFDGSLAQLGTTANAPVPTGWVDKLNLGSKVFLRATLSLPSEASNSSQDKHATVSWTLTGEQAAGKTTVVDPTKLP